MNTEILKPTSSQAQGRIQMSIHLDLDFRLLLTLSSYSSLTFSYLTLPTILLTSLRVLLVSTMLLAHAPAPAPGPCHNSFRSLRYPEFRN